MKTITVVQCNHVAWEGTIDASLRRDTNGNYVIEEVIKRAKQLTNVDDSAVIACPDQPENEVFREIAERMDCHIFMGSKTDVLRRLYDACVSRGGERIAWLQGINYFLDVPLMDELIAWARDESYDYARCPDASCKFTLGQVVTIEAIDRARKMIDELAPEQKQLFAARPFAFTRARPEDFKIGLFEKLPQYTDAKLEEMRHLAQHIYMDERAWHTTHACPVGDMSRGRYQTMLEHVPRGARVLDIACGTGYGAQLMTQERGARVIGVDISPETIDYANDKYGDIAEFRLGNAEVIPLEDDAVDLAVSIGTIEHIDDDDAFVKELSRVLRPGGQAIIYTPQSRVGRIPIWHWHAREYSADWLKETVAPYFEIDKVMGWQNGELTPDDERGDGMYLFATNKN